MCLPMKEESVAHGFEKYRKARDEFLSKEIEAEY